MCVFVCASTCFMCVCIYIHMCECVYMYMVNKSKDWQWHTDWLSNWLALRSEVSMQLPESEVCTQLPEWVGWGVHCIYKLVAQPNVPQLWVNSFSREVQAQVTDTLCADAWFCVTHLTWWSLNGFFPACQYSVTCFDVCFPAENMKKHVTLWQYSVQTTTTARPYWERWACFSLFPFTLYTGSLMQDCLSSLEAGVNKEVLLA